MGKWDKWFDEVYAEYRASKCDTRVRTPVLPTLSQLPYVHSTVWEEHKRGAYTIFTEQLSQMAFPKYVHKYTSSFRLQHPPCTLYALTYITIHMHRMCKYLHMYVSNVHIRTYNVFQIEKKKYTLSR